MIYLLSRFDLKSGEDINTFRSDYDRFCNEMKLAGFCEGSSPVCERVKNTPMDTDADDAQRFYSIMKFSDRQQLDKSYAFIASGKAGKTNLEAHDKVNRSISNAVFTCWEDPS